MPKVLGDAVGLSPLLVLVSVTTVGILFSGWAVLFAVPIAAVLVDPLRRRPPRRRPGRRGGAGRHVLGPGVRGVDSGRVTAVTANDRDLRLVAAAIAVSAIGDWVAMIALSLRANELWHGAGVAVLLICLWAPLAALAGHVGVLVDRLETRALAIGRPFSRPRSCAALAFAHSLAAILALTLVLGAGVAVSQAAEFALVPLLAGTREIGRANGLVESARSIGFMVGPLIGGGLAAGAGIAVRALRGRRDVPRDRRPCSSHSPSGAGPRTRSARSPAPATGCSFCGRSRCSRSRSARAR